MLSLEARFWSKVDKNGPIPKHPALGACWLWLGTRESLGYGRLSIGAHDYVRAHQVGGAYLARLERLGLVKFVIDRPSDTRLYRITEAGRAALEERV